MERFLFYELVETNKGRVTTIHNQPTLLTGDTSSGILVEFVPEPLRNGQSAILYCNPTTKELWYEYTEPLPQLDIEQLKTNQILIQKALDDLLLGGM